MLISKRYWIALVFFSFTSSTSFAAFDIFDEDSDGYYGSGQTRPFKDVIENNDSLSATDQAFLQSVEETRITDRSYMRVMAGKSKIALNNLENTSTWFPNNPLNIYVLDTTSVGDNLYQLLISGGHIWQNWVLELEFFLSKQLSYYTNPVLLAPAGAAPYLTSAWVELKQYALLLNVQYVIPRWFSFYPRRLQVHLDAGAGVAALISNVSSTATDPNNPLTVPPIQSTSTQSYPAIGMLGIGARYQVSPHFLTGVAYRYYNAGKSKYGPVQSVLWQSNQLRTTGFFIDVTYQF